MNVLSLFDGHSCGQIALKELGMRIDNYFASEIDKHAIAQTKLNFPDTVFLGDVRNVRAKDLPRIDLVLGGSPCQGFSFAGAQLNFEDPRSALFFEFERVLNEVKALNPNAKFLFENVRMQKKHEAVISQRLGIQPVEINSALVSAQNRRRLYWSNIRTRKEGLFGELYTDIPQPADRHLVLSDILEEDVPDRYFLSKKTVEKLVKHRQRRMAEKSGFGAVFHRLDGKAHTLAVGGKGCADLVVIQRARGYNDGGIYKDKAPTMVSNSFGQNNLIATDDRVRRFTPTECCRLQTVPSWCRWECSETQQYKMLGNGWTIEVIKHILKHMK